LDTTIDKIDNSEVLIKIKLKEDDYQPRVSLKIKDFSKKASIKGFRPGKVPVSLIKSMYGNSFMAEEVNKMISEELNKTLKESDLQFLGEPLAHESQQPIDWETQKDFEFIFNIGYAEPFEIKIDKKVKVDFSKIKVDKKVIDETIGNIQKQFGELSNPEVIGEGDTAFGPIGSEDESINQEVSLDLSEMKPAVAKKFIGLKVNDTIVIDTSTSFKDDSYFERVSRLTADQLKAVKHKLTLTVKGINHTVPAEIGQDLFDKTFGKDNIKDGAEFTSKVTETIEKNYEGESEKFFHYKIREHLTDKTKITLPDGFLKRWLIQSNENITEEVMEEEYIQYTNELKWSLIRNQISKDQSINATYEEVREQAKQMIVQQFGGPAVAQQLGDQLNSMADNYLQAENGDNYMKMQNEILNQRVFEYVASSISAKEKEVSLDEFRKL
jgi:trigger factor